MYQFCGIYRYLEVDGQETVCATFGDYNLLNLGYVTESVDVKGTTPENSTDDEGLRVSDDEVAELRSGELVASCAGARSVGMDSKLTSFQLQKLQFICQYAPPRMEPARYPDLPAKAAAIKEEMAS